MKYIKGYKLYLEAMSQYKPNSADTTHGQLDKII